MLKNWARGQFPGVFRVIGARAGPAGRPGICGRAAHNCTHGLLEKPVRAEGRGGTGRLRTWRLTLTSAEKGVEGLGHDARGARVALSADSGVITGPALRVRHDRGPRGGIEDMTIPLSSLFLQGPDCQ